VCFSVRVCLNDCSPMNMERYIRKKVEESNSSWEQIFRWNYAVMVDGLWGLERFWSANGP